MFGPVEQFPAARANRVFHRYTYDGQQMCMRETYRNGTGDAIVFTRPEVTRIAHVVPGGGGSAIYADSDGTQDTVLVDTLYQLTTGRTHDDLQRQHRCK